MKSITVGGPFDIVFLRCYRRQPDFLGVTQVPTWGGHTQTDSQVERLNRTLKQMMSKLVSKGEHN